MHLGVDCADRSGGVPIRSLSPSLSPPATTSPNGSSLAHISQGEEEQQSRGRRVEEGGGGGGQRGREGRGGRVDRQSSEQAAASLFPLALPRWPGLQPSTRRAFDSITTHTQIKLTRISFATCSNWCAHSTPLVLADRLLPLLASTRIPFAPPLALPFPHPLPLCPSTVLGSLVRKSRRHPPHPSPSLSRPCHSKVDVCSSRLHSCPSVFVRATVAEQPPASSAPFAQRSTIDAAFAPPPSP